MPDPQPKRKRIGFQFNGEEDLEPMKSLNTAEEETEHKEEENEEDTQNNSTVMLEDYIPGAIYDGNGNIVTYELFRAKLRKVKAEAKSLRRTSFGKTLLYLSLAASIALLSYGVYNKYLSGNAKKAIITNTVAKERQR